MLSPTRQIVAAQAVAANPELARAPSERLEQKVHRSVSGVIWLVVGLVAFGLGCVVSGLFVRAAIKQNQPVSAGLMFALLVPLVPAAVLIPIASLRLDPELGGPIEQVFGFFGAAIKAIRGQS